MPYRDKKDHNSNARKWYAENKGYWKDIVRIIPETKECRRCHEEKSSLEYGPQKRNRDGLKNYCRPCDAARGTELRLMNPQYRFKNTAWARKQRAHKYGITQEQYTEMLENQKGLCVVCEGPPQKLKDNDNWNRLYIDHDHKTNKVRGLLCRKCNLLLGFLEKNEGRIKSLNLYLKQSSLAN